MMKKPFISILLLGFSVLAQAEVIVLDSWVRLMPPVSANTAAFMTIKNTGTYPLELISVKSDDFEMVQVHKTSNKNGIMRMQKSKIIVPANGSLHLKPKGYHLMLMGKKTELYPDSLIKLALKWHDGTITTIYPKVRRTRR